MNEVVVRRDVRVPTAYRGLTLSADLYLPTTTVPHPVLVTVLPYRKDFSDGLFYEPSMRWLAEHGYVCVLAELRGIGSSDGLPRPKNDPAEAEDCLAVIDWAAEQPWSDGQVGMWGCSAGAVTTMRAAATRTARLRAVMAIECPLDPGRQAFHHDGARADLNQRAMWSGTMLVQQLLPPLLNHISPDEQRRWRRRVSDAEPFLVDLARPAGDPALAERAIDAAMITTPTFCVGGWRDLYAEAMTQAYQRVRGPRKLLIGPWAHGLPHTSPFTPIDFLPIALRWWDHWLRGADTGLMTEPPVTVFVMGARPVWRHYPDWPPPAAALHLATGTSTLLADVTASPATTPATEPIAIYEPDPTNGAQCGLWGIPNPGPWSTIDQHDDDMRSANATSLPFPRDVALVGAATVTVHTIGPDESGPDRLVVKLADVDADGRSTFVTAGVLCPGEARSRYELTLRPAAYRFAAGHRLRLAISDSDFPRLTPLPSPRPITVTRLELLLPHVSDTPGEFAQVAAAPNRHGAGQRRFTLTRDHVDDGVTVTLGALSQASTSQNHQFRRAMQIQAHVRRAAPGGVVITGEHSATVELSTGERVHAVAHIRCTQSALLASGSVAIDGTVLYAREWNLLLEPEQPPHRTRPPEHEGHRHATS